jgi:hypothetical protein
MDDASGRELRGCGVRGRHEGRAFTVMGDAVILKAASPDVAHTVFEVTTRAPLGPPPRRQPWAETYHGTVRRDISATHDASRQFGVRRPSDKS